MFIKNALISVLALIPSLAQAASVNQASYNPKTEVITVEVTYGGGCKEHKFDLEVGGCKESFPVQCEIKLIDQTTDDFCEALISRTLTFKAADYGLLDSYYDNAGITIQGDDESEASFKLVRNDGRLTPATRSVSCPTRSGRTIQFLPEYGEVHYLNADGSEWKQYEDGLTFDELQLESFPVQFAMTITDDEGSKVGGWRYVDGASSFKALYRGKTYSGCKSN